MEAIENNFICFKCKHWNELGVGCKAFPEGIPNIIDITNKHNKPLPSQNNNIVFEKGTPHDMI